MVLTWDTGPGYGKAHKETFIYPLAFVLLKIPWVQTQIPSPLAEGMLDLLQQPIA